MNLEWWGSPFKYSVEYKCTKDDMPVTTHNIIIVRPSNKKPHSIRRSSQIIQGEITTLQIEPQIATSYKPKTDNRKLVAIADVDIKQLPLVPIKRPKPAQDKKLKKGKINKQRYIEKKIQSSFRRKSFKN